jgi:hypothetical protein
MVIEPSNGIKFLEERTACVNTIGFLYAFLIIYWSFLKSIKVFLIIKASRPLAVFAFSSQYSMDSLNYFKAGISSISCLVIDTFG